MSGPVRTARSPRLRGHWDPYRVVRPPEEVLHTETPTWREIPALWARQIVLVLLSVALLAMAPPDRPSVRTIAWVVMGVAVIQMLVKLLRWWHKRYIITNARLLIVKGVWRRRLQTIPLSRIAQVHFSQTILERFLGGARVKVIAAGQEHPIDMDGLADPERFHRILTTQMTQSDIRSDQESRIGPADETIEFGAGW